MKKNMNTDFSIKDVNKEVTLYGWVARKRDLGGLVFIDLRDKSGIIQICVKPENKYYEIASNLKSEYVIKVEGKIVERESKNKNLKTGEIEVDANNLEVLIAEYELSAYSTDNPSP